MANNLGWNSLVIFVITVIIGYRIFLVEAHPNHDLIKNFLVYYDFDNMTESKVPDKSGNSRLAEMRNINIEKKNGICGKSIVLKERPLLYQAKNASTSKESVKSLNLTVAAWIFLLESENETRRTILKSIHKNMDEDFLYFGIWPTSPKLRWSATGLNAKKTKIFKPNTNADNVSLGYGVWHHVAVSFSFINNGTKSCCHFYVNGTEFMSKSTASDSTINVNNPPLGKRFFIGASDSSGTEPLNGFIDEFYILNRTLNKEEIQRLMTNYERNRTNKCERMKPEDRSRLSSTQNTPSTIKTTIKVVPQDKYTQLAESVNSPAEVREVLLDFVDEKFQINNTPTSESKTKNLIKATEELEKVTLTMASKILTVNQSETFEVPGSFFMMSKPISGFTFPSVKQQNTKDIAETISFPDDMVQTDDGVPRAFVCMAYSTLHETMPDISSTSFAVNTTLELNSKIIGAAVDPPLDKPLKNGITITFTHDQISSGKQYCSFWNHSIRATDGTYGEWSTEGCVLNEELSTPTKTVCSCNHLTNFALLLQREGEPYSKPPLSLKIITIIGCTLSILACLLCFIMFLTLKKKDIRHHLHIHLTFAIAIAMLILLFGIERTEQKILCKAMAACLHYFYMVAFLLMLCEGIHLVILIETAFSHGDVKLPVYLGISWGLPLIIVGITLGVRYDSYGDSVACFISAEQGAAYAFVGPIALILLINFVILVIVLRQVIMKTSLPISSKSASRFEIARATIRSLAILFPIMGFTWIFGVLFFALRTLALEYLFAIFCSLQGFFIFLFQYALNTENRTAFLRASRRWGLSLTSSTNTTGNTYKPTLEPQFKISPPEEEAEIRDIASPDNCHLMVYRTVDDTTTIDSRTASTFI